MPDCEFPEIFEGELAGERIYYMTGAGLTQQEACRETAQANHDIALENAIEVQHLKKALNEMSEQGAAQRDLAQFYLEDLEERRRATSVELLAYKGLLALVAIAAIL